MHLQIQHMNISKYSMVVKTLTLYKPLAAVLLSKWGVVYDAAFIAWVQT